MGDLGAGWEGGEVAPRGHAGSPPLWADIPHPPTHLHTHLPMPPCLPLPQARRRGETASESSLPVPKVFQPAGGAGFGGRVDPQSCVSFHTRASE